MIWFKLWDPVYYRDWTDKSGKVLMHPGRSVGFPWNIVVPIIFKVIHYNEDLHKRNIVVHRGVVVSRFPTAIGYNSSLAPKSDDYFPDLQVEGGATSKTAPLGNKGTVDPPNITTAEGRRKRHKPLSSPPKSAELD